jgi:hypothetical protein
MKKDGGLAKYYDYECESDEKETKNDSKSSLSPWLPFCLLFLITIFWAKAECVIVHKAESSEWRYYEYAGTDRGGHTYEDEDNYFVLFEADNGTVLECRCTYSQFVKFNKWYKTKDWYYEHTGYKLCDHVYLQYDSYRKVVRTLSGSEFRVVKEDD